MTDKFGGLPVLLDESDVLEVPKCDSCSQALYLVLQVIAPLEKLNLLDRVLYLFSCNNSACPKHTWTLLRKQLPPPSTSPPPPSPSPDPKPTDTWSSLVSKITENKDDEWGNDNDDTWGVGNTASEDLESLLKIRDVTISQKPIIPKSEPKKEQQQKISTSVKTVTMPSFSPIYIEWSPEPPEKTEKLNVPQEWMEDVASEWQGEEYEEDVDRIWKKFKKTIAREPEQCLRYGNTPLTQKKLEIQVPKCEYCSGPRIFEFQLLPTVFDILEDMQIKNALEFANILCYTCEGSCQQAKFCKEFIHKEECL
uniref:Programmed cell death protein 2 C-terminal domain-containing protein n=1 Tax=Arcella intermedia TaxID=1963864 RepID=A0A6B2LB21_9EUKA